MADVLTNRNPPYGIAGGLYDALLDTNGLMYSVSNAEGSAADKLIRDAVGIDPDPAAAIATGSLIQAIEKGLIGRQDHVLLNLTGGGYERVKEDFSLCPLEPAVKVTVGGPHDSLVAQLKEWIDRYG
jgi:cysteate synthase